MPSVPRFFIDQALVVNQKLALPRNVAHHAVRVLRLPDASPVVLFNGQGGEYQARLQLTGHDQAEVLVDLFDAREAELGYRVHLGQGMCASDKMDWLIEKSVELGAARLSPLALSKSVVRLSGERAEKRTMHWRQLIVAASQQCGRNQLMQLDPPATLAAWLSATAASVHRLVLAPAANTSLAAFARASKAADTALLIGPEGGLSDEEFEQAIASGCKAVGLGRRVLRTESAAMVALASLNALWED